MANYGEPRWDSLFSVVDPPPRCAETLDVIQRAFILPHPMLRFSIVGRAVSTAGFIGRQKKGVTPFRSESGQLNNFFFFAPFVDVFSSEHLIALSVFLGRWFRRLFATEGVVSQVGLARGHYGTSFLRHF